MFAGTTPDKCRFCQNSLGSCDNFCAECGTITAFFITEGQKSLGDKPFTPPSSRPNKWLTIESVSQTPQADPSGTTQVTIYVFTANDGQRKPLTDDAVWQDTITELQTLIIPVEVVPLDVKVECHPTAILLLPGNKPILT